LKVNFLHGHGQLETLEPVTRNLLNYGPDIENYEKGLRLIIGPDLLSFETAMIAKKYCFLAICFNRFMSLLPY